MKLTQEQPYPAERPHLHGGIKKNWRSSGVFIVNFEKITLLFLVFHCWIWESVAGCFYQKRSKYRQVTFAKDVTTGKKYAILTKWVKVQHEKESILNVKCMQIVGLEQIYEKFIFSGKKTIVETISVTISDSSDVSIFTNI